MGNCSDTSQEDILQPRLGRVSQVNITNHVWDKQYLGLFDFDSKSIQAKNFTVNGTAVVLKSEGQYILTKEFQAEELQTAVFRLLRCDNYYQMTPIEYHENNQSLQKPIWIVVKSLPSRAYPLRERDYIKFGKQKIKVCQIASHDQSYETVDISKEIRVSKIVYDCLDYDENIQGTAIPQIGKNKEIKAVDVPMSESVVLPSNQQRLTESDENTCRICLQPGEFTNPLIRACKCIGSIGYLHLICLKIWLGKQIKSTSTSCCVTIEWKRLSCEMCKAKYKYRIYMDNTKFYTVDIPKPARPYVVLETTKKKGNEEIKIFKFITFEKQQTVHLGRKKEVDVRISEDISVSRVHAMLTYDRTTRQVLLTDNESKFGTLVLAKKGLLIRPHHRGITVQVGAELYQFQAEREKADTKADTFDIKENYLMEDCSMMQDEEEEDNESEEEYELEQVEEQPSPTNPQRLPVPV